MNSSPHEGRVPGRMSRSPTTRCQNSRHQTYWRISVGKIEIISILSHYVYFDTFIPDMSYTVPYPLYHLHTTSLGISLIPRSHPGSGLGTRRYYNAYCLVAAKESIIECRTLNAKAIYQAGHLITGLDSPLECRTGPTQSISLNPSMHSLLLLGTWYITFLL